MGKLVYIAIVIIKRKTLHCELLWKLVTVNSLELGKLDVFIGSVGAEAGNSQLALAGPCIMADSI